MKYFSIIIAFLLFSCKNNEKLQLPKTDISLITQINDYSVVYFFYEIDKTDTILRINKNNLISTTNWVFNIDKRLPLKLVIPEVKKLQTKKLNNEVHKNDAAQNYYSYADNKNKNLAFKNITNVSYDYLNNQKANFIFITKNNTLKIENEFFRFDELTKTLIKNNTKTFSLCFDKNITFQNYLEDVVEFEKLKQTTGIKISNTEYIY